VRPEEVAQLRGKTIAEVLPIPRASTRRAAEEAALAEVQASADVVADTPVDPAVEEADA
jgi:hypothetical protein